MSRVTIKEIARRCGVSQGAVSYAAMNAALDHVASLGHRTVARVAGPPEFGDVWIRDQAF